MNQKPRTARITGPLATLPLASRRPCCQRVGVIAVVGRSRYAAEKAWKLESTQDVKENDKFLKGLDYFLYAYKKLWANVF